MPVLWVQRKASLPSVPRLKPTTTLPSFETPLGCEEKVPPWRSPIGVKVALSGATPATAREERVAHAIVAARNFIGVPAGGFGVVSRRSASEISRLRCAAL